jgi:hypothetical protein
MTMTHITRKIAQAELDRLGLRGIDDETEGWAVVRLGGDKETVCEWFADRHAAEAEAAERNED